MRPPPPDTSTPMIRQLEALGGVHEYAEVLKDPAWFQEHRQRVREKMRLYPEPIELAHLALKLRPVLCAKGRSGWLEALREARDYFDDAIEAAIVETDRDREKLRLKLEQDHFSELMAEIRAGGFLRFEPKGNGDDEFRRELQKNELESGFTRADGYWCEWAKGIGDPDPKKPGALLVSALLLAKAIQEYKSTKILHAAMRRKKQEEEAAKTKG